VLIQIADILSAAECAAALDALSDGALWRDGRQTAKGAARAAKNNLQADGAAAPVKGVVAKVKDALAANKVFRAFAQPDRFVRVMVNRYETGMAYGPHVDAAYIGGVRADLSFTVFLNAPETYDGGELMVDHAGHEDAVRLPAGGGVVYLSTAVHHVAPVTRGARTACIGWVKSRVRAADRRVILFELEQALADLRSLEAPQPLRDRLNNVRNNLLRQFGE